MSAKIIASAVSQDKTLLSSIKLAAQAAQECIDQAGIDANEVDYLMNVGVYRDQNMVEPSMAALIQKELGINPDFTRFEVASTAFSCDLMNGVNGALNACQVAGALFKNQKAKYVLIVSGDVHPSGKEHEGIPFKATGAALLLAPAEDDKTGFSHLDLNAGELILENGEVGRYEVEGFGADGRNQIKIERQANYLTQLHSLLYDAGSNFMRQNQLKPENCALIVPAFDAEFADCLGQKLGFPQNQIINTWSEFNYTHTSSFTCGLQQTTQLPEAVKHLVYVGAGAGLNAVCAAYRH